MGKVFHSGVHRESTLVQMSVGDDVLNFYYDNGTPVSLTYNGTTYYYITNLQGDVMSIVDGTGAVVASYEYDPYGNILSTTGTLADTLGVINPLRYRGYVYDQECNLYYLQSRYYDPKVGRFINADVFASTGQGILGNNMFAYCGNNPVSNEDPTGNLYTPTELHNFVLKEICDNDPQKTWQNTHMVYEIPYWKGKKFSVYGYCDLYDTVTHEIWDAKHFGGGLTCTKLYAMHQVKNYVDNGTFTKQAPAELKVGGTVSKIEPDYFIKRDRDGQGNYVIWYWDAGDGVIFYDYVYFPSGQETLVAAACIAIAAAYATGNIPTGTAITAGLAAISAG